MPQQFSYKRNNEKAEHNAHHDTIFLRSNGEIIAEVWGENEATAAFIVRACNNHHELIASLERAIDYIRDSQADFNIHDNGIVKDLEMVISKAKGE